MRIANTTRGTELASNARRADTFMTRLVGLLGRRSLEPGEALLIEPCSSVHTMFMRFTIDVLYIDDELAVVKAVSRMRPFRTSAVFKKSCSVIELPAGVIDATGTMPGDRLALEEG